MCRCQKRCQISRDHLHFLVCVERIQDRVEVLTGAKKMANEYWGIVIAQSLRDDQILGHLNVISKRRLGGWEFILTSISADQFADTVATLQDSMVNIYDDCWYAHFFRGSELIVVYQDRVFRVTADSLTWEEAIGYGRGHGIPMEQLDFHPRTKEDARSFFDVA